MLYIYIAGSQGCPLLGVICRNQGTLNIGLNVLTTIISIIAIIPKCFTYVSAAPGKVLNYLGKNFVFTPSKIFGYISMLPGLAIIIHITD